MTCGKSSRETRGRNPCAIRVPCYTFPRRYRNISRSRLAKGSGVAGRHSMEDEVRGGPGPARIYGPYRRLRRRGPYRHGRPEGGTWPTYAALDLGTNNCRLLVARPTWDGFRVIDAFSRIIRLGEGVSASGVIGEAAILRAVEALAVCRDKM